MMNSRKKLKDRLGSNSVIYLKRYFGFPVIALAINYYSIFSPHKLLGDKGDARLSIVIYEHWWRFFQGQEKLTSTIFFFPADETLGLTDAFFVPGTMHSIFRYLGFSILDSWSFTNIALLFLGIIGIARAGSRFLKNDTALLGFVLLASVSYPFVTQLGHIQTLGYLAVFWFLDWIYLARNGTASQRTRSIYFLLIGAPLLALSAWYPFALLLLICGLGLLVELFSRDEPLVKQTVKYFQGILISIRSFIHANKTSWIPVAISTGFWALWIRIYKPVFYALENHTWGEINFYSPRLGDLINASNRASGYKKFIYDKFHLTNQPTYERALGLTLTLFIFIVCLTFFLVRKNNIIPIAKRLLSWKIMILAILPMILLIQDEFGRSAWFPIWKILPGAESIRAPYRISIYCSWLLIGLFYFLFQNTRKTILMLITIVMIVDTTRVIPTDWDRTEFLPSETASITKQLEDNKCDAFYLRPKQSGDNTIFQIDSEVIATVTQTPTVNGYSGNFASGWPVGLDPASNTQIKNWLKLNNVNSNASVCIFNDAGIFLESLNLR